MSREHLDGKDKYRPKKDVEAEGVAAGSVLVGFVGGDAGGVGEGGGSDWGDGTGIPLGFEVVDQEIIYSADGKHTVNVTVKWDEVFGAQSYEVRLSNLGWSEDD